MFVVKAEVKMARKRTEVRREPFFADNTDPRALQPITAERGFGMDSNLVADFQRLLSVTQTSI